jgi:hypothetical protein
MITMAIEKTPPFEQDDKGFRDACIMFSLFGYLNTHNEAKVFFISNDKIFKRLNVVTLCQSYNVMCYESINAVLTKISDEVSSVAKAFVANVKDYIFNDYSDEESVMQTFNSRNFVNSYGGFDEADEVIPVSCEAEILSESEKGDLLIYSCVKHFQISGMSHAPNIYRDKEEPFTLPFEVFLSKLAVEYVVYISKGDLLSHGIDNFTFSTDDVFYMGITVKKVDVE